MAAGAFVVPVHCVNELKQRVWHLHPKGSVFGRGWESPGTGQDDPAVWMGARRELSLCRNKSQSGNTVMKRMSLHLGTPDDHH